MAYHGYEPAKVAVEVGDGSISTAKIAADAVTAAKIADDVVAAEHYASGSVDATALGADAVTAAKIGDNILNSEHYAAVSIDNEHLANDAVGADELAADAVVNASVASGAAIDATKIADGSVTSAEFQYINTLSSNAQTQISAALPKAGGAMTGAITTNSTFDGVDIATRDAILSSTTTTAGAALPKAGGTMTGNIVMGDDTSIGISDSDERIEFDGAGDISLLGCNVGIGIAAPTTALNVVSTAAIFRVAHTGNGYATELGYDGLINIRDDTDSNFFRVAFDGTERIRVLAAGGLTFNGDTAQANALDDYEEGTWTPGFAGSPSFSSNSSTGHYTRIGNVCHLRLQIDVGTVTPGSGSFYVTGLPFASADIGHGHAISGGPWYNWNVPDDSMMLNWRIGANTGNMYLFYSRDGATDGALAWSTMTMGNYASAGGTYLCQ